MSEVVCDGCEVQKDKLFAVKSELMDMNLFLCKSCKTRGIEPRYVIILTAQTKGFDSVRDQIINKKYFGKSIEAKDVL